MASERDLKGILVDVIDRVISSLSTIAKAAVYQRLMGMYRIRWKDVPDRLEEFHEVLTHSLGSGAVVVERMIAEELYSRLSLTFQGQDEWGLADYVDQAKKQMASRLSEECATEPVAESEETS